MKWTGPRGYRVEHVVLDQPLRPDARACLPGAPAEHFAVKQHGFLVAVTGRQGADGLDGLRAALPFDLTELVEV
jgi:hypothetical protein